MFILFACIGCFEICIVAYLVAMIHEAGHLIAAKLLGYSTAGVKIELFGVCLKLNDDIMSCRHEFFISIAGPLMNFVMLTSGAVCTYLGLSIPKTFMITNLYMLFINLLPVMPLDGGRVIMAVLKAEMGEKRAQKLLGYISIPIICILAVFGVVLLFKSKMNASLLLVSIFMCNNIKITGNKSTDILALYNSQIAYDTIRAFYVSEEYTVKEVIKVLPFERLCVIFVVSDDGEIKKIITNKYILGVRDANYLNLKITDI